MAEEISISSGAPYVLRAHGKPSVVVLVGDNHSCKARDESDLQAYGERNGYFAAVGPFETRGAAEMVSAFGKDSPNFGCVEDAEEIARESRQRDAEAIGNPWRDIYINTHIRINTPAYRHRPADGGQWWISDAAREAFYADVDALLESIGFHADSTRHVRGEESLFCHPDDLSGHIKEGTLDEVLGALRGSEHFAVRWVDLYDHFVAMSPQEYGERLAQHAESIKEELVESLKTSNKNKAYRFSGVMFNTDRLVPAWGVGRWRSLLPATPGGEHANVHARFISSLIDELVASGVVARIEHGGDIYLRTRGKTEFAAWQREQRAAAKAAEHADAAAPGM